MLKRSGFLKAKIGSPLTTKIFKKSSGFAHFANYEYCQLFKKIDIIIFNT